MNARTVYRIDLCQKTPEGITAQLRRYLHTINSDEIEGKIAPGELMLCSMEMRPIGRWWWRRYLIRYEFTYCPIDRRCLYRREPFYGLRLDFKPLAFLWVGAVA